MAKKNKKSEPEGLFIPAGVLTGLGFGFVTGNVPAGLFIGLGAGFALMAIVMLLRKTK
jgi:hypothetical protein